MTLFLFSEMNRNRSCLILDTVKLVLDQMLLMSCRSDVEYICLKLLEETVDCFGNRISCCNRIFQDLVQISVLLSLVVIICLLRMVQAGKLSAVADLRRRRY